MQILEILKYVEENSNSAFFYTPNIYERGKSYWFKTPHIILSGSTQNEVEEILEKVDELIKDPELIGFATIPYEIGYYFQPKKIRESYEDVKELQFIFYKKEDVEIIESNDLQFDGVDQQIRNYEKLDDLKLEISKEDYVEKIEKIKDYIRKGDTYQINFTTKTYFTFSQDINSLFLNGIFNQSAGYSSFINSNDEYILSFSPELFFKTNYDEIVAKPMKGTVKRKGNSEEDKKLVAELKKDEKNLAENVMIVDLMRNDIGKIAHIDSVKVDKLYEVEKYETLFQLTSTVTGKLKEKKFSDIIRNLFPSGSITGAPKIRSMRIINELENSNRNLYTGTIGILSGKEATFNIPIRTISINKANLQGDLGLGSGIVWDSDAENEYDEVLLKGKFISEPEKYFELLETMLFENGKIFLLEYHIRRLKEATKYFLFKFDEESLRAQLNSEISSKYLDQNKCYKARLLLNKWGYFKLKTEEILLDKKNLRVKLSSNIRSNEDKYLFHKTTNRPWDRELSETKLKGYDEVIYLNEKEEILEGAISNIIVEKDGKRFTSPIELGILNGCYRQYQIDMGNCEEKILRIEDLVTAEKVFLCNSVRKEISIDQIHDNEGKIIFNSKNLVCN